MHKHDNTEDIDLCRLRLRAVEPDDVEFIYRCDNDVSQWVENCMMAPLSRSILMEYAVSYDADIYRSRQIRFICEDTESGLRVGIADIFDMEFRNGNAFVGVYTLPEYRRRGVASTMLALLSEYAFSILSLNSIAAKIVSTNITSIALFEKAGYSRRGKLDNWIRMRHGYADILFYQLSRNQLNDGFSGTTSQLL